jgi:hypothetical protein
LVFDRRPPEKCSVFSQKWVHDKVPTMDSTEFHAVFHEAATRGWDEDELRQLDRMWSEESGAPKR